MGIYIETERLLLREFEEEELPGLAWEAEIYPAGRLLLLAVEEKLSQKVIGRVDLGTGEEEPKVLGVGCMIAGDARNRGFATEAVAALLEYARKTWNCSRFAVPVKPGDRAFARVLEKNGFQEQEMRTAIVEGNRAEFRLYRRADSLAGVAPRKGRKHTPEMMATHCRGCGMVFPHGMKQCPICGAKLEEISGEALKRLRSEHSDSVDFGKS